MIACIGKYVSDSVYKVFVKSQDIGEDKDT